MRTRLRTTVAGRVRALPARSRVTVRRTEANLVRSNQMAAALRDGRQALTDIQGQLDALLEVLRNPAAAPDATAADRLRRATREAASALAMLSQR